MFDQLSSETDIYEYRDFDIEVVTSILAIDLLMVDWREETRNKSIAEFMEMSDAAVEEEELEMVTDGDENRKIAGAEALKKLDKVKSTEATI